MSTLADVSRTIKELNEKFPRPGISLVVSNIYDLRTSFASSYPNVSQPGIYVMMDSHGKVLRIGKASCGRTLGDRLGDYFKWGDRVLGSGVASILNPGPAAVHASTPSPGRHSGCGNNR
jgi:hypothetical protein